jgi:hypothetical protein
LIEKVSGPTVLSRTPNTCWQFGQRKKAVLDQDGDRIPTLDLRAAAAFNPTFSIFTVSRLSQGRLDIGPKFAVIMIRHSTFNLITVFDFDRERGFGGKTLAATGVAQTPRGFPPFAIAHPHERECL